MSEFVDGPPSWREFQGRRFFFNHKVGRYKDSTGLMLAKAVWCATNGPVPDGYDIHHINEDRADDALANLELRSSREHRAEHSFANGHQQPEKRSAAAREAAKRAWASRKPVVRICEECGEPYETRSTTSRFCSGKDRTKSKCSDVARRRRIRQQFRVE